jgi:hypothetical protein
MVMKAIRLGVTTLSEWENLPDRLNDKAFAYVRWREKQLTALRDKLIERKAEDAASIVGLFVEGL